MRTVRLSSAAAELTERSVALLGVPWDAHSSLHRGCAAAPEALRRALRSGSSNLATERGRELGAEPRLVDVGDVEVPDVSWRPGVEDAAAGVIERAIGDVLATGARALVLGGDHAVSVPSLRAHAARHRGLTILHLDAHPDLYDEFEGDRLSHACPFARIMEEGLATRLIQVGIRTLNAHQRAQAARFGVEIFEMRGWDGRLPPLGEAPLYVSIDFDALDPAFAPGVSHHEPGGLTSRQVLGILDQVAASGRLVGADLVEYNPARDVVGMTAAVGVKLAKELLGALLGEGAPEAAA